MKEKIFTRTIPDLRSKKELLMEQEQKEMWKKLYSDHDKSVGKGFSLNEFKELMKERKFVEFTDVKTFLIPKLNGGYGMDIVKKDIPTLIVLQKNGTWHPKYGSCSGSSGSFKKPRWTGKFSLDGYGLTDKEIRKVLKGKKGFNKTIRYKTMDKNMRTWTTDENNNTVEVLKPKCQNLETRSDYISKEFNDILNELRNKANEKFKNKTKTYSYWINDIMFPYTVNVTEYIGSYSEDIGYSFYFYDKDGNYVDSIGTYLAVFG